MLSGGLGGLKLFPWGGLNTPNNDTSQPTGALDGVFPFRDGTYNFTNGKNFQIVSAGKNGPKLADGPDPSDPTYKRPGRGFGPGSKPTQLVPAIKFAAFKAGEIDGYLDTDGGVDDFSNFGTT